MSSTRLPDLVLRVLKPLPAAVTVSVEAPAPNMRSPGTVVVAEPLSIAAPAPVVVDEASSELTGSTPEYSWI